MLSSWRGKSCQYYFLQLSFTTWCTRQEIADFRSIHAAGLTQHGLGLSENYCMYWNISSVGTFRQHKSFKHMDRSLKIGNWGDEPRFMHEKGLMVKFVSVCLTQSIILTNLCSSPGSHHPTPSLYADMFISSGSMIYLLYCRATRVTEVTVKTLQKRELHSLDKVGLCIEVDREWSSHRGFKLEVSCELDRASLETLWKPCVVQMKNVTG